MEGKDSTGSPSQGRHTGLPPWWWWEAVGTQDGLLEETMFCLVPPKKSPPCFESKEGCFHVFLIYTKKASGRAAG